jgi:hypothetical protein
MLLTDVSQMCVLNYIYIYYKKKLKTILTQV